MFCFLQKHLNRIFFTLRVLILYKTWLENFIRQISLTPRVIILLILLATIFSHEKIYNHNDFYSSSISVTLFFSPNTDNYRKMKI